MLSLLRLARCSLSSGFVTSLSRSLSGQPKKCVNITFAWKNGRNKTVYAKIGDNLLDVVLDNDVDIDGFGACEGTLACSTCHLIFAKEDFDNLRDPLTEEEQDMLDLAYGLTDTSRLGCQVKVNEDMDGIVVNVPESIYDARA
ncbi:Adrenodoxin, mitochondrial [Schistosoma haematobium]|uniref:Adrenodoxin, mitochondrial n=1 Tax=Schistosoma haematobium TaxID=6185 RepID=A0A922IKN4_SCHHA|nr:Adrenodoxin, mitochondrial [Schistosoma haematobium]KAH9581083.1 Adrenodoxin, mitochondrial [Schistosoma haematobium]